jgi:hypothetical protein
LTLHRSVPGLALIALLLVGCPPSEDEERQTAALTFLSSPPTPSSIEVLQPRAAEKLAEIEPDIDDDAMRENLVTALVLIDDEASHQLLVQVLIAEPQRVSTAFDSARQYGKLGNQLAVLYDQLDDVSRTAAFLDVCWPAYVDDDAALLETCGRLWAASEGETQSRWMRQFTHVGPSDDPAAFERLREGVATDRSEELDEIVLRVGGGEVIPAEPAARKLLRLSTKLEERRARYSREATGAPVVPVEGGFVELIPPDPGTDFGRVANQLLADVPLSCAGAWGGTASDRSRAVLEVVLHGTRQAPTVRVVSTGNKKSKGASAPAGDGEVETPATPEETLRACFEQGLAATHGGGSAPWVPRSGTCRLTLNFQRGASPWAKKDEGRVLLSDEDLRLMGERLRDSGTAEGRAGLDLSEHDPAPLRDLGSMDLGFCVAYVARDWTDCAVWLGEVATSDEPLQAALRRGLRDVEPAVRTLCRTALAVQLDEEALEEAAKPPEPAEESGATTGSGEPSAQAPAASGEATGT